MNPQDMNPQSNRFLERADDYAKVVQRLIEVYAQPFSSFMRDSAIQRFELCWELAWKVLRLKLEQEGIEALTPRQVFQEALQAGLIQDGNGWSGLQKMRNLTSHTYNEALAEEVYDFVRDTGVSLFVALSQSVETWRIAP